MSSLDTDWQDKHTLHLKELKLEGINEDECSVFVDVTFYKLDKSSLVSWVSWLAQSMKQKSWATYTHVNIVYDSIEYGVYWQEVPQQMHSDYSDENLLLDCTVVTTTQLDYILTTINTCGLLKFTWKHLVEYIFNPEQAYNCLNFVRLCLNQNLVGVKTCDQLLEKLINEPRTPH